MPRPILAWVRSLSLRWSRISLPEYGRTCLPRPLPASCGDACSPRRPHRRSMPLHTNIYDSAPILDCRHDMTPGVVPTNCTGHGDGGDWGDSTLRREGDSDSPCSDARAPGGPRPDVIHRRVVPLGARPMVAFLPGRNKVAIPQYLRSDRGRTTFSGSGFETTGRRITRRKDLIVGGGRQPLLRKDRPERYPLGVAQRGQGEMRGSADATCSGREIAATGSPCGGQRCHAAVSPRTCGS